MTSKKNDTTQLLDKIIESNSDILESKEADPKTKFAAQDRILKALAIRERQTKKAGRKFDLT